MADGQGGFWSGMQGLLDDPNQLQSNPWFNMGMGLLSENQKAFGGDPYAAVLGGMSTAQQHKEAENERERKEKERLALVQYLQQMQMGGTPQQQPINPITGERAQMSMSPRNYTGY